MNKYEQLIEYIINDQEDKARELFHSIVVAKSRDIYESLMDETVDQYDQQGDLVDDITSDETGGLGEADEEFDDAEIGGEDGLAGDDMGDDMGGDDMGDEGGDDMGDEGGDLSDKFQDIKSAIEELEAEFNSIVGGEDSGMDAEMGDGEIEGGEDMPADDMEAPEELPMEGKNPFAKSGSSKAASGSGKSGSGKAASGSGKSGSGKKMESRSAAELMREYVEKISDGHGAEKAGAAEGQEIGKAGSSVSVNKTTTVAGKNDMGGTAANMVSGKGNDTSERDGTSPKGKAGGFMKAPTTIPGADRNVNKVGGNKGAEDFYKTKAKAKSAEGSTTDGSVSVSKDSVGYPNK